MVRREGKKEEKKTKERKKQGRQEKNKNIIIFPNVKYFLRYNLSKFKSYVSILSIDQGRGSTYTYVISGIYVSIYSKHIKNIYKTYLHICKTYVET